jgi:hypothetical protein
MPDFYAIVIDPRNYPYHAVDLHRLIKDAPDFTAWWHYIDNVYIVKTSLSEDAISEMIRDTTKEANLLVIKVNIKDSQGWLPKEAWDWIKSEGNE